MARICRADDADTRIIHPSKLINSKLINSMGLPGHRRTSSHKRRRASHFALTKRNLAACAHCKKPVLPHHACAFCGWYDGREVMKVKAKGDKGAKDGKR